jgi:hypothetical protein
MPKPPIDPDTLKIPAYLRKTAIYNQAKQQLILTALDRKQAGLPPGSKKPTAKIKKTSPYLATLEKIRGAKNKNARTSDKTAAGTFPRATVRSTPGAARTATGMTAYQTVGMSSSPQTIDSSRSQGRFRRAQVLAQLPKTMPLIGTVTDYWEKIGVAGIKLTSQINKNNFVLIEGESGLFKQSALEMQIDRQPVLTAPAGSHIGLKVENKAILNGKVYKLN